LGGVPPDPHLGDYRVEVGRQYRHSVVLRRARYELAGCDGGFPRVRDTANRPVHVCPAPLRRGIRWRSEGVTRPGIHLAAAAPRSITAGRSRRKLVSRSTPRLCRSRRGASSTTNGYIVKVPAVAQTLRVLEMLAGAPQGQRVSHVAEELGVNKAIAHRILQT